jgi:hypothetical protein
MLAGFLAGSVRLRQWSLERGVELNEDLAGLEILDAHLDEWNVDPTHHGRIDHQSFLARRFSKRKKFCAGLRLFKTD